MMGKKSKTLTLGQVERMKSLYEFDVDGGVARYKSNDRVVDTRPYGKGTAYICLNWNKNNKLFQDGDATNPRLHRIVYALHHQVELSSSDVIDHISSARDASGLLDNSVSNLRLTTHIGNCRNVSTNTGLNFVTFYKPTNTYRLKLPIVNHTQQEICALSSNKFNLIDMQHLRNHLVHKHNIDTSTCPPDQCWTLPSPEQLASIINRIGSKCNLRKWL